MTREYTYQDIDLFFERLKTMPEYLSMDQVKQFIQNPKPSSPFHLKRNPFKLWTILITTASVITISALLYFNTSGTDNQHQDPTASHQESLPPSIVNPLAMTDSVETDFQKKSQPASIIQSKPEEYSSETDEETELNHFSTGNTVKHNARDLWSEPIDGNPFIIDDISLEELRKLGFDIQHYSIFYRNTNPNAKCIYFSWYRDFFSYAESRVALEVKSTNKEVPYTFLKNTLTLSKDTFPEESCFFNKITTEVYNPSLKPDMESYYYKSNRKDYFPVYVSTLSGETFGIQPVEDFEHSKDTLIPLVIPFSRLNCTQKEDLVFWFHTTDIFFNDIPERYSSFKAFISNNKRIKRANPNALLVDYDLDRWISEKIFTPGETVDGSSFIIELNREEQERIGLYKNYEAGRIAKHYYLTPWGRGKGSGGKRTWVKTDNIPGTDSIRVMHYDTVFKVDFLPWFMTDSLGNSLPGSTSGKLIQSRQIQDDLLIPIKDSNHIYWFTQSDSLWTLLPDRYKYLQEIYHKIFFTKSIYPDIDLVKYFHKELEHIDMNVEILDLSKSELEDLGFVFIKDSLALQSSVFNKEYIQFRSFLSGFMIKAAQDTRSQDFLNIGLNGNVQVINEGNKDWQKEKNSYDYEELVKSPFQGFQFALITDEIGHELVKFRSLAREEFFEGKESQYLIPVRVPMDKYFSEYSETKIFWFTPTEAFFDRLPDRINENLRQDFYSLTGKLEGSSCTYFEECKSTLELNEFKIYPNPANESISISFTASELVTGNIYLIDIKGRIIKTLESKANIKIGNNEFRYTLDMVQPGIYLVAIQSEGGIKTARLIVTE